MRGDVVSFRSHASDRTHRRRAGRDSYRRGAPTAVAIFGDEPILCIQNERDEGTRLAALDDDDVVHNRLYARDCQTVTLALQLRTHGAAALARAIDNEDDDNEKPEQYAGASKNPLYALELPVGEFSRCPHGWGRRTSEPQVPAVKVRVAVAVLETRLPRRRSEVH